MYNNSLQVRMEYTIIMYSIGVLILLVSSTILTTTFVESKLAIVMIKIVRISCIVLFLLAGHKFCAQNAPESL